MNQQTLILVLELAGFLGMGVAAASWLASAILSRAGTGEIIFYSVFAGAWLVLAVLMLAFTFFALR